MDYLMTELAFGRWCAEAGERAAIGVSSGPGDHERIVPCRSSTTLLAVIASRGRDIAFATGPHTMPAFVVGAI